MPMLTFKRHMTFIDAYRSKTGATLVGMAALVTVAAVDVAGGRNALSVIVATYDVA